MENTLENPSYANQLKNAVPEKSKSMSAVSWGAILAGAVGAASLALILLVLGTGLGLSGLSPWANEGMGRTAFGISAILWISLTQVAASGVGGYLAGRLRTRWVDTHSDEVFFRDTAHGFLTWGVATLLTASLVGSLGMAIGKGAHSFSREHGPGSPMEKIQREAGGGPNAYFIDSLFRRSNGKKFVSENPAADNDEVARILANGTRNGGLSNSDKEYLTQMVSVRADIDSDEAAKRVNSVLEKVIAKDKEEREMVEKARKSSAYASLWFFISLLAGAFVASYLATFGGRLRDQ